MSPLFLYTKIGQSKGMSHVQIEPTNLKYDEGFRIRKSRGVIK